MCEGKSCNLFPRPHSAPASANDEAFFWLPKGGTVTRVCPFSPSRCAIAAASSAKSREQPTSPSAVEIWAPSLSPLTLRSVRLTVVQLIKRFV